MRQKITPFLWFDTDAEEAANLYVSIFPNSRISGISRYPDGARGTPGAVMTVSFELDGQPLVALNGGPRFTFDEAISFQIDCESQDEVDYYWDRLTEGGVEQACGWLKDRYGLSWQVVPSGLSELLADPDPQRGQRAMQAMLTMTKLDLPAMQRAADGEAG